MMSDNAESGKIDVLGVKFDKLSLLRLLPLLDELVEDETPHFVCFSDSVQCVLGSRDPDLKYSHGKATLLLPDGVGITIGARLLGGRFPHRLPGPAVMLEYCRFATEKKRRHFFYGGEDGVAERLAQKLQDEIPQINVVGYYAPPFRPLTDEEEKDVKKRIEQSKADVLWVGLGAPKQEQWMAEHLGKINVPLMLGVGAAFDFWSGHRKRAPVLIQKIGFEWLYRMITGGRRIFLRNAKYCSLFLVLILKAVITKKRQFLK